jgi:hypothetical protein
VLSPEERSEIARNAVKARWAKKKGTPVEDEQVSGEPDHTNKLAKKPVSGIPVSLFAGKLQIARKNMFATF